MAIVSYQSDDQVGLITISRPERRNALNHEALAELHSGVRSARDQPVRALIVTGSHGHFCAGADLKELEDLAFTRTLRSVLDDLADAPFPTIAAISGSCMGLGAQIALACDLRVADSNARFAVPVAKLGLMVDHWTLQRLALLVGHSMARWMTLTAAPITTEQALTAGFVHEVTASDHSDPDSVLANARRLAARISELAPLSLAGTKLGLNLLEQSPDSLDSDDRYQEAFEQAWASADLLEGRHAFTQKRPPIFRGV
jgi:enoyl-CoA hydratase